MEIDPALAVFVIALFFFGFYVVGSIFGRRRVAKIVSVVAEAVSSHGGKLVTWRSGVSAAVLSFKEMGNLAEFSVVIGIITWANPLSYLISKALKRKDLIIIRAKLRTPPSYSLALIRKDSPARRYAGRWGELVGEFDDYLIVSRDKEEAGKLFREVLGRLNMKQHLYLLALNKELPHLHAYIYPGSGEEIKALLGVLKKLI